MTLAASPGVQNVQVRLGRFYLNKLRTASAAVERGLASVAYGLELFDREWGQIKQWQAYSTNRRGQDRDWTRLCLEYSLAGLEVLSIRQNLADQAQWLEASLEAAHQLGDQRAELHLLNALSGSYFGLGALEKSANYAGRLLERGRELNDRLHVGRGYYRLGSVAEERGLYAEALEHNQRALEIFTDLGSRADEGRTLHAMGAVALYQGDAGRAYPYFLRDLELMEAEGNMSEVCRGLLSVAQALMVLDEGPQAEPYLRRAIRLSRSLGFQKLLGAGLIMLGQWYGEQGQTETEIRYLSEGITVARSVGSQRDVIHGLSTSGFARMLDGDLKGALADLEEGLQLARQAGIPRFICNLQRNIADTYLALNDLEAARPALQEALGLAQAMGSTYQIVKVLTSAIGYWQLKGSNEQAARWAGSLMGRPEADLYVFEPICERLDAALGPEAYHRALEEGRKLDMENILAQMQGELARETKAA